MRLEEDKGVFVTPSPHWGMNRFHYDVMKKEGLKSSNKPDLVSTGKSTIQDATFINDAARVWNFAPLAIKECKTLFSVKKQIKIYTSSLPI